MKTEKRKNFYYQPCERCKTRAWSCIRIQPERLIHLCFRCWCMTYRANRSITVPVFITEQRANHLDF